MSDRESGTVDWFNDLKGTGFISPDNGPNKVSIYRSIRDVAFETLSEGDRVTYTVSQGPRGLEAYEIKKIPTEPD